ncbi:hypothetical protein DSLASN_40660 [Desulfoluna limicola]|uniref:Flagellar assembly protein FliH n=1 Tax=Desulfoluna limicola TaxID=2810562 RepID=A0ABM7PLX5_9BACT|nr:FliH/SctL family protein [Desulfoluna limicola]BCS98434.1 hypothetical protein DSLASN_40660 [Desulfoluna limicola]
MTDDGFQPLVGVSAKQFETTAMKSAEHVFQRLEFKQEEPGQAPASESVPQDESVSGDWEQMAPVDVVLDEAPVAEEAAPESSPATASEGDPGLFEVEQQAFDMGFEKGEREGFLKGEERAMEMLVRLENLILGFEGAWRKSCENREKQLVQLALVVAEKVALAKAERDDEMAARSLVEALSALENPGTCTVRVNQNDFSSVERLRGDLFQRVANLQEITILPDGNVDEGEVRLESDNGWLETHARKRLNEVMSRVAAASGLSSSERMEATGVA